MGEIRKSSGRRTISNYFGQEMESVKLNAIIRPDAVGFLEDDAGFRRLYFAANDIESLRSVVAELSPPPIVLEFPCKRLPAEFEEIIGACGFRLLAVYHRLSSNEPKRITATKPIDFARPEDVEELHALLHGEFDPYLDRLPTLDALAQIVQNERVILRRGSGRISGYFVFEPQGARWCMNYWAVRQGVGPHEALGLMMKFYALAARENARSVYTWVNRTNTKVTRVHEKFGLRMDGLLNYIFLRA